MHIAVLDDDVASRRHMDRLLTRASDENKRNGAEGYYIDLYGSFEPLSSKLAMYDAIFIDMVDSEKKGHEMAVHIHDVGIPGKIILMTSKIRYYDILFPEYVESFSFIDKPIDTAVLRNILNECESLREQREPKIEIRTKDETLYIKYEEFIYAKALVAGKTTIVLSGPRDTIYYKDIALVKKAVEQYPFMIQVNSDVIVSLYHIKKINTFSIEMDEGSVFRISLGSAGKIKKYIENYKLKNNI